MNPIIEKMRPPKLLKLTRYEAFKRRYREDWAAFAHDCIELREGEKWASYQDEIFAEFSVHPRICVRAPHGAGKTAMEAVVAHAFALTRDGDQESDWKMPTTASVWRQLTKFLWPEIHKWARRIRWDKVGREMYNPRTELLAQSLKLSTGEAFAVASDNHESIEGAHADSLLYGFDEAKAIIAKTFDAAEGAFSTAGSDIEGTEAFAFTISTPGTPEGRFYEIQSRKPGYEDWWVRHITLEEAMREGRISALWAEQRRKQWGEKSAVYQNRVLGEFAESSEDSIIPLSWVEKAIDRWEENYGVMTSLGVDVGLGGDGSDSTVIASIYGNIVAPLRRLPRGNVDVATMETAGRVKGILDMNVGTTAFIDVIGIGAGVVHRLNELGYKSRVVGFNVAEGTREKDRTGELGFINKRAAMWWLMREALDPNDGENIALPPDDLLVGDLTAPKYSVTSTGKIKVEDKREVRKRIGRSPDSADAVLHGLFGERLSVKPNTLIYIPGEGYYGE